MKKFLKTIFAVFIGTAVFSIVAIVIAIIGLAGMAASASSSSTVSVKDNSVLVLPLDGELDERGGSSSPLDYITGNSDGSIGLTDMVSAIHKAKTNDKIKGIYIEAGFNGLGGYLAQVQELREALADFKKSGKWIVAYGDMYTTNTYYVASIADKIYVNPSGSVDWHGLGGRVEFYKNTLAKVGIKFIPFKCGKYKSATEPYTEDHMSQPSREQTERYIGGWWKTICQDISKSRNISVDSLNSYADRVLTLDDTKSLIKNKMVDGLLYADQMRDAVKKRLDIDKDDEVPQVSVYDLIGDDDKSGDKVAVYYASGEIVDVLPQQSFFNDEQFIVGNDMVADMEDLADDDDVKAVVLRVNSPGGSAYASEQIWHAIEMLKKKKPVVVSMSGVAASGGYYLSCDANYIYADPNTITGSIGIYGLALDRSELMTNKLGITYDEVKTNRNSLMSLDNVTPMTAEQMNRIQSYVNNGYRTFKSRVAQGRHLSMDAVEQRAQGHVFLGSDALQLKLVDGLGGLDKAVEKAAQLAKLKKYHTINYPEPQSFLSQLFNDDESRNSYLDEQLHLVLGNYYDTFMMLKRVESMSGLQARLPYILILK